MRERWSTSANSRKQVSAFSGTSLANRKLFFFQPPVRKGPPGVGVLPAVSVQSSYNGSRARSLEDGCPAESTSTALTMFGLIQETHPDGGERTKAFGKRGSLLWEVRPLKPELNRKTSLGNTTFGQIRLHLHSNLSAFMVPRFPANFQCFRDKNAWRNGEFWGFDNSKMCIKVDQIERVGFWIFKS